MNSKPTQNLNGAMIPENEPSYLQSNLKSPLLNSQAFPTLYLTKNEINTQEHGTEVDPIVPTSQVPIFSPASKFGHDQCYNWLHAVRAKKDSESSDDSSISSLPMPPPPDSGWGWLVVFGAFLVTMICDGIAYSFGVLYSELLVEFDTTRSMASLVGSIFLGVSLMLGPLASSLTTRFGCRRVTILGGLLSSVGFLLCYFVDSIEMLCLTFGVVIGAGFSCCYITSVVIVAFYFEKRRALATGLSVCGTGVGTFSFAPMINYLISEFGLKGQFLIMSGVCLNLVVCGMLFRPLKFSESERRQLMLEEFEKNSYGQEEIEVVRSRYPSGEYSDSDSDVESAEEDIKSLSTFNLPTYCANTKFQISNDLLMEAVKNSKNPDHTIQRYMKNAVMHSEQSQPPPAKIEESLKTATVFNKQDPKIISSKPKHKDKIQIETFKDPKKKELVHRAVQEKIPSNIESHTSVYIGKHPALAIQLPLYRNDIFYRRHQKLDLNPCKVSTSCPELIDVGNDDKARCWCIRKFRNLREGTIDVLCNMIDFQLFKNRFFNILLTSNFLFYTWSDVPYMYAVDHATKGGLDHQKASFLVSVIGIANTIGQVFFGYIGDRDCNILNIYAVVSILAGGAVIVVPWLTVYWIAGLIYGLFGFFVSVSSPLTTVLLVRFLGMDKLTNAYGILMLVQGVANLIGPPVAGYVSDLTLNYDSAFYLSGLFHVISGLVLFLVHLRPKRKSDTPLVTSQTSQILDKNAQKV